MDEEGAPKAHYGTTSLSLTNLTARMYVSACVCENVSASGPAYAGSSVTLHRPVALADAMLWPIQSSGRRTEAQFHRPTQSAG